VLPDWQLPPGTDRGLWDYVNSERVAREYDDALAGSLLLNVDVQFCEKQFEKPGRLIDLGCGTGRLLVHFAKRGFECVGVDMSDAMLEIVHEKASQLSVHIDVRKANLVELDEFTGGSFDYAACLFSTFGMIRGEDNRARFLNHVRRILKPGGVFVVHAHNSKFRFGYGLGQRGAEPGDRTMPQIRGGAELTIHHFSNRELLRSLAVAGFRQRELLPVSSSRSGRLRLPWLLPSIRAHGFLVASAPIP
jgi:ubiquinone/menaquinone biosynthesis C-methylase UbiE